MASSIASEQHEMPRFKSEGVAEDNNNTNNNSPRKKIKKENHQQQQQNGNSDGPSAADNSTSNNNGNGYRNATATQTNSQPNFSERAAHVPLPQFAPSSSAITKHTTAGHPPLSSASNSNSNNSRVQYGAPIPVETAGTFPQAGSILGPYFCLGTLGKGTFSSIHHCINLDYGHRSDTDIDTDIVSSNKNGKKNANNSGKCRMAAAKVELSTFVNSGVLLGEALVLHFLDEALPRGTVPVYLGHYTAGEAAAIVMEYLPGEDMHQLRENRNSLSPTGRAPRRLTIDDAVYLTADVMLPLLEQMHKVGIVHRDVKPSNCVRSEGRQFCMVDFGLSKSIVVPMESGYADADHPWPAGQPWLIPPSDNTTSQATTSATPIKDSPSKKSSSKLQQHQHPSIQPAGCFRKERTSADFRGTSMYASPRVHQGRDYCPRDDVWSLLYVFCDLVSGGLPWMSHAANRDRDMCQKIKEQVHGLVPSSDTTNGTTAATAASSTKDESEKLLMGDDYHVAMFRHDQKVEANKDKPVPAGSVSPSPPRLPVPLEMSQDKAKVKLLRQAFSHLAKLQFWDQPDYNLIRRCIQGFLDEEGAVGEADDIEIEWTATTSGSEDGGGGGSSKEKSARKKRKREAKAAAAAGEQVPTWQFRGEHCDPEVDEDPMINSEIFEGLVVAPAAEGTKKILSESEQAVRRLPLEQQFRIAQMEYHAKNVKTALPHIVLQDWMKVAIPLLYADWDSKAYESGGHRTSSDGYRREYYLELVEKCSKWARQFDTFSKKEYLGYQTDTSSNGIKVEEGESPPIMKRQIVTTLGSEAPCSTDLASVSKILFGLKTASRSERCKSFAPPPLLSFGVSR